MAYLLRGLVLIMFLSVNLTIAVAHDWVNIGLSHIQIAIPTFLYTIFAQAFAMFYFIVFMMQSLLRGRQFLGRFLCLY